MSCCINTVRLIIVHDDLLVVKGYHISMAYGRKVTEGLLIWNVSYCCLLANEAGMYPAMVLALPRTMSKVLEVSLMPYSPSPSPSPSGPTCPSSYHAQKAAPFKALPLLRLCRHRHVCQETHQTQSPLEHCTDMSSYMVYALSAYSAAS